MENMLAITILANVLSLNTAASAEERVEIEDTLPITATCEAWLEGDDAAEKTVHHCVSPGFR